MLTEFIDLAMEKARFEILENGEGYYGEISGFDGVWANGETLEECKTQLREVLEEWSLLKINKNVKNHHLDSYSLNDLIGQN